MIPIAKPRYVAICDILGYSRMVETIPINELGKRVQDLFAFSSRMEARQWRWSEELSCELDHRLDTAVYQFSDTIIFWSDEVHLDSRDTKRHPSDVAAGMFLFMLCNFFVESLISSFPMRVGISYGDTYIANDRSVIIGLPIIRAHELQLNQDWVGLAYDDTVAKKSIPREYTLDYKVPLKRNDIDAHPLRWACALSGVGRIRRVYSKILDSLALHKDQSIATKYQNTKDFMLEMLKDTMTMDGKRVVDTLDKGEIGVRS